MEPNPQEIKRKLTKIILTGFPIRIFSVLIKNPYNNSNLFCFCFFVFCLFVCLFVF